jgi:tetratricopeptide (TPR) repeat protein/transcriptional regulator with XRE-family HTH domain
MARDPEDLAAALVLLRWFRRWTQAELAEKAGIAASSVCEYETGRVEPTERTLRKLLAALRFPFILLDALLACLHVIRQVIAAYGGLPDGSLAAAEAEALVAGAGRAAEGFMRSALLLVRAEPAHAPTASDLQEAPGLRALLEPFSPEERLGLVRTGERFRGCALAKILCDESEEKATHDAQAAVGLAQLAVEIAHLAPGSERWRSELAGYCEPFLGNALRVNGDLPAAREAFARSYAVWPAGTSDEHGLLDPSRRLDLEASLRRAERRIPEALALLDQALAICPPTSSGRILVKKAKTLEEADEYEEAIAILQEALPRVGHGDAALRFALLFNLAENLHHVGHHAEAEPLLAEVRELAERFDKDLHRVRLRWLAGRVAAGLGRVEEAIAALREVRDAFIARGIPYDAALATLELAVLLAEQGRTAEVKRLAGETEPIFKTQGVERERLGALRLFCQAAGRERLTADLARRLLTDLRRAASSNA